MINKPNKRNGLVPAKNAEKIGVADPLTKKFFELNEAYLNVWLLCDGKKDEKDVAEEFAKYLINNSKKKVNKKKLVAEAKEIIKRLMKFNLLE